MRLTPATLAASLAGVAVHLMATSAFGYLLFFLLDARVPRTVDRGGPAASPAAAVAIDLALVALFAVPHSLLARRRAKRALAHVVPTALERSAYNLVASLALGLLFWQWRPIPAVVWSVPGGWPTLAMQAAFWGGWALCAVAALGMNLWDLTGLRQSSAPARGASYAAVPFRTPGPYRLVRHPLYLGFVLALWAAPRMTAGHLLLAAAMTAYMVAAIPWEERDLVRDFGDEYARYRGRVPALVPWRGGR